MTNYIHPQVLSDTLFKILITTNVINAHSTWKDELPEWAQQIVSGLYSSDKYVDGKRVYAKPDMAPDTLWGDVHKLYRSASAQLIERVQRASIAAPDNQSTALLLAIAQDIYGAAEDVLKTSQAEKRYKRINNQKGEDGAGEVEKPTEVPAKGSALKAKLQGDYSQYSPIAASVASALTDTEIEATTILARRVAIYSFVGKYGLMRLPEASLRQILQQSGASAVSDAGRDLGEICTALGAQPYGIEYGLPKEKVIGVIKHNIEKLHAVELAEGLRAGSDGRNVYAVHDIRSEFKAVSGPDEYTDARNLALAMAALATRIEDDTVKAQVTALATQVAKAENNPDLRAVLTSQAYGDAATILKAAVTHPNTHAEFKEKAGEAMRMIVSAIEIPETVLVNPDKISAPKQRAETTRKV